MYTRLSKTRCCFCLSYWWSQESLKLFSDRWSCARLDDFFKRERRESKKIEGEKCISVLVTFLSKSCPYLQSVWCPQECKADIQTPDALRADGRIASDILVTSTQTSKTADVTDQVLMAFVAYAHFFFPAKTIVGEERRLFTLATVWAVRFKSSGHVWPDTVWPPSRRPHIRLSGRVMAAAEPKLK